MQTPAELVPIPESSVKAPAKLRKVAAFWENPENFWPKNVTKIQRDSGKICEIFVKNQQNKLLQFKLAILNKKIETRERCKKEPRYPRHTHSLFSRFFFAAPFR